MIASVLVHVRMHAPALQAQLEALIAAGDDVELVIVADCPTDPVREILEALEGDVRTYVTDELIGRRNALAIGTRLAGAEVCIVLGPLARPEPGFAAPLVAAVEAGAALAAPVIDAHGIHVHGYDVAEDGSVWPRGPEAAGAPGALAHDCFAARPQLIRDILPAVDLSEGLEEVAVARLAARIGPLVIAEDARVRRETLGPPGSVLVASRNRGDEVGTCVEALVAHGILAAGGEIVVVDNGSTDGTDATVEALAAVHGPGITLVREPVAGASRARNTGAAACRHPLICLIDDDARPAPGWFEHMRDAFVDPEVAAVGGPVRGLYPADRDREFPPARYAGYVSALDLGDVEHDRDPFTHPGYGASWAMRADVWRAAGGLPEHLGASDVRRINGEETALEIAVHSHGFGVCRWAPGAAVGHRIGGDRLNEDYFLLRSFRCGAESCRVWSARKDRSLKHVERHLAQALARVFAFGPLPKRCDLDEAYAIACTTPASFDARMQVTYQIGMVAGASTMLGRWEHKLADGTVLIARPEHADGHVRVPAVAPVAASRERERDAEGAQRVLSTVA